MEKNTMFRLLVVLGMAAGLSSCIQVQVTPPETSEQANSSPSPLPAIKETATAIPPAEESDVPQATPSVTVDIPILNTTDTPVVKTNMEARVYVQGMALRSGPGTLYEAVSSYPEGTIVTMVGRAAGDDWVKVETDDNRVGWMLVMFLELDGDISELQLETVKDSHIIYGHTLDQDGLPVNAINLAVYRYQGSRDERTDAYSTADGSYYAYLPASTQGTWAVEVVGFGCSSNIMDADCKHSGHFEPDRAITFDLPYNGPFDFTYVMP